MDLPNGGKWGGGGERDTQRETETESVMCVFINTVSEKTVHEYNDYDTLINN